MNDFPSFLNLRLIAVLVLAVWLSACGGGGSRVSDPTFEVDPSVQPRVEFIPFIEGDGERPVASIADDRGRQVDFVEDEVILTLDDRDELSAIVERLNGVVLKEIDPTEHGAPEDTPLFVLVRIDPSETDPSVLRELILSGEGENARQHRVSSQKGLDALTAMALESFEHGTELGANFLFTYDGLSERETLEGAGSRAGYSRNAFELPYMNRGSVQDIGAAEAARMVRDAGRVPSGLDKVDFLIMDGGFLNIDDYPDAEIIPRGRFSRPNPNSCSGGSDCFWHGTNVASAALGIFDDGIGAAGPASEVVRPIFVQSPNPNLWDYLEYIFDTIPTALGHFPEIVNISASGSIPAGLCLTGLCHAVDVIGASVRAANILVFASAGNDGANVDAEDCFIACWEEEYRVPCEAPGVICVGGLGFDDDRKAGGSAWGRKQRESSDSVDIYAPYSIFVHDTPDDRTITPPSTNAVLKSGTSFSSPFTAAVGALIKAADPTLDAGQIWQVMAETAHRSSRINVHRWVDAYSAVHRALGDAAPPYVRILQPTADSTYVLGASAVPLSCDVDDPDGMETVEVTWSSDLDGYITDHEFSSTTRLREGEHVLSCTVSDGTYTITRQTTVRVGNVAPTIAITNPDPEGENRFYQGQPIGLSARVYDANDNADLSTFRWSVSQDVTILGGGTVPLTYWSGTDVEDVIESGSLHTGVFTLTASVEDTRGLRAIDSITIEVLEDPAGGNLPPSVRGGRIEAVPHGDFDDPPTYFWLDRCSFDANEDGVVDGSDLCQTIRFTAFAEDDHDAPGDMTYEWTVEQDGASGTTTLMSPTFQGDFMQGTFTVTVHARDTAGVLSNSSKSWTFTVATLI